MGWDNLLKEMGDLLRLIKQAGEDGVELNRRGELGIQDGSGKSSGIYDLHIHLGTLAPNSPIGKGEVSFSPPLREKSTANAGVIEPVIDLFDEPEWLVVVAQMPGVTEPEVRVEVQPNALVLRAGEKDRQYYHRIPLSFAADLSKGTVSFTNGVLEVRLPKPPADKSGSAKGDSH